MNTILIVEDDVTYGTMLKGFLSRKGYSVEWVTSVSEALKITTERQVALILSDLRLPDRDGIDLLTEVKEKYPQTAFIMMTGYAEISSAVQSMKLGASDYISKPIVPDDLIKKIQDALAASQGGDKKEEPAAAPPVAEKQAKPKAEPEDQSEYLHGTAEKARELYEYVRLVAPTDMSVLINGASGTGKEYVAKLIHMQSKRAKAPFVAIDCGALPKDIAASELFGHIKGSFTGAVQDKTGHFVAAQGGTIFLDEIGNLSYEVQVQLLRALQEKKVRPVGGNKEIDIDVRVVSATNENLQDAIAKGVFREDLYHRINEFTLKMPTLQERKDDIMLFANFFLNKANIELEREAIGFDPAAERLLKAYSWPGNLRELKNVIKRAVLLTPGGFVTPDVLPSEIVSGEKPAPEPVGSIVLKDSTQEKTLILEALQRADYNKSKAAKMLGIDRKTLYNKLKLYQIPLD
ncbi:MAG TPA: sigma-54-dependent Fis family transcriptional regulator [Porphyromonadaceae bacterium]|nr:sigma-54-dependent Fis family transcriptional regulator [Porphyromonadaceae bacterium]